ncbi:hypothetical protein P4G61_25440, partial [Bacillus cereus]|nr:hypothetical protein [Bacillus cereus]
NSNFIFTELRCQALKNRSRNASIFYEKFLIIFSLTLHENVAYILYYNTYERHKRIEIAIPYANKV